MRRALFVASNLLQRIYATIIYSPVWSFSTCSGVLYIMIKRMMTDLAIFMEVFVYIVLGFCLAFYSLYHAEAGVSAENTGGKRGTMGRPIEAAAAACTTLKAG